MIRHFFISIVLVTIFINNSQNDNSFYAPQSSMKSNTYLVLGVKFIFTSAV